MALIDVAVEAARSGVLCFPLIPRGKVPLLSKRNGGNGVLDATSDEAVVRRWWMKNPDANIGQALDRLLVVDLDPRNGALVGWKAFKEAFDGDALWAGEVRRTGAWPKDPAKAEASDDWYPRGVHLVMDLPPGVVVKAARIDGFAGLDIKTGAGSYVLYPGSVHENGDVYEWVEGHGPDQRQEAPGWLLSLLGADGAVGGAPGRSRAKDGHGEASPGQRTGLAALLADGPSVGDRNNWVTKVLGHYAKALPFEDGYRATAELVFGMVPGAGDDYTRDEFDRTVESVWSTEKTAHPSGRLSETTGYLTGNGQALFTEVKVKDEAMPAKWASFDPAVERIAVDEDERRTYLLNVDGRHLHITGATLGTRDGLNRWATSHNLTLWNPADQWSRTPAGMRLQRYMESQGAPVARLARWLGPWEGQYLCHEGVIGVDGLRPWDQWVPDPARLSPVEAPWHYGFAGDMESAIATLREVLTFHDELTMALVGSWWACLPVKDLIMQACGRFPMLAVAAGSGTGKSTGALSLMWELNGRTGPGGSSSDAGFREELSKHRAGVVWIDDMASIAESAGDYIRLCTAEQEHSRRGGEGFSSQVRTRMVGPLVLSAEGLDLLRQKAYAERAVQVELTDPKERRSIKGDYLQWDDIVALQGRYADAGGLSSIAGWLVQRILQEREQVAELPGLRIGTGRHGDKLGTIRTGARILESITGLGWIRETVDAWAIGQETENADPYLIAYILPAWVHSRTGGDIPGWNAAGYEPVWQDEAGVLHVNAGRLAQWWQREHPRHDTARAMQLGSVRAIQGELRTLVGPGQGTPRGGLRYVALGVAWSRRVLDIVGRVDERLDRNTLEL